MDPRALDREINKLVVKAAEKVYARGMSLESVHEVDVENAVKEEVLNMLAGREFGYETNLDGLGKFKFKKAFKKIKRPLKRVAKGMKKVIKKVAPIALAGAAVYFGGPVAMAAIKKVGSKIASYKKPSVDYVMDKAASRSQERNITPDSSVQETMQSPAVMDKGVNIMAQILEKKGLAMRSNDAQKLMELTLAQERAKMASEMAMTRAQQAPVVQTQYVPMPTHESDQAQQREQKSGFEKFMAILIPAGLIVSALVLKQ